MTIYLLCLIMSFGLALKNGSNTNDVTHDVTHDLQYGTQSVRVYFRREIGWEVSNDLPPWCQDQQLYFSLSLPGDMAV